VSQPSQPCEILGKSEKDRRTSPLPGADGESLKLRREGKGLFFYQGFGRSRNGRFTAAGGIAPRCHSTNKNPRCCQETSSDDRSICEEWWKKRPFLVLRLCRGRRRLCSPNSIKSKSSVGLRCLRVGAQLKSPRRFYSGNRQLQERASITFEAREATGIRTNHRASRPACQAS
jgi:hypothetical protein